MKCLRSQSPRPATILTEFVVCCVLMAGVAATLVPLANHVLRLNENAEFESLALIEIANVQQAMKSDGPNDAIQLSDWITQRFPDAELKLQQSDDQTGRWSIAVSRPMTGYSKSQEVKVSYWTVEVAE